MDTTRPDTQGIVTAVEWRLIGLLLERPRPGWHEEVRSLSREVRDRTLRAAAAAASDAAEGGYLHLMGPGALVSPREVTYQPFADPGQLLAELATAYDAFAFRPHMEEPIDHIAVEVAFVGYLLLKEAFATMRGDDEAAVTTSSARRGFMDRHLAAFAAPFAQRLEQAGPSYLHTIAQLLAARLPAPQTRQPPPSAQANGRCGACGSVGMD